MSFMLPVISGAQRSFKQRTIEQQRPQVQKITATQKPVKLNEILEPVIERHMTSGPASTKGTSLNANNRDLRVDHPLMMAEWSWKE